MLALRFHLNLSRQFGFPLLGLLVLLTSLASGKLMANEKAAPAKLIPIKLGTAHFPPFRIFADGTLAGADTEVVNEVFARMGFQPDTEVAPFKRIYSMGTEGQVAAIYTMTRNPERENLFYFSQAISSVRDVLFKHKTNAMEWKNWTDLKGSTIGTSLGYSYPDVFLNAIDANLIRPDVVAAAEPEILHLRKIQQRRIDYAICEVSVCNWLINQNSKDLADVVAMKNPIAPARTFHLAFSKKFKNAQKIRKKFDTELVRFLGSDKHKKILARYNMVDTRK